MLSLRVMRDQPAFTPSDFVAVLNQTLEYAYPSVVIVGELSNFRVSKSRWVYFDLKDDAATVKFFGTVYALPGPLEEGMVIRVVGQPRLSPQYGFSVTFQSIVPVGEGSLKRAADLLRIKLTAEGLFDDARKRQLPYPPRRIGLVTSGQSAAYHDFIKILNARWRGVEVVLADVQVQGDAAPQQIVTAIELLNQQSGVDVLVITRGGGSADDLAAFSSELVTRAVAASRAPTLVAVGHEVDVSLAELAADRRASTPSNAAELLIPDVSEVRVQLAEQQKRLETHWSGLVSALGHEQQRIASQLIDGVNGVLARAHERAKSSAALLQALNPEIALLRGYAIVRKGGQVLKSASHASSGDVVDITLADGSITAKVQ